MFSFCKKLKALKPVLKSLNKARYGDIHGRVLQARSALLSTQREFLITPRNELLVLEKNQSKILSDLFSAVESFLKQKLRINWLQEGDQKTKFFHKVIASYRSRNCIDTLTTADGTVIHDDEGIISKILAFYKQLLGTADTASTGRELHYLQRLLPHKVSTDFHQGRNCCSYK